MAKLTEKEVQKLQPGIQVFDDKLPGFGIRKQPSGKASYFVKYAIGKQQRRLTLGRAVPGNLEAMRLEASKILLQAHTGVDVVADRKAARAAEQKDEQLKTVGELVPIYLEVREKGDDYWSKLRPKTIVEIKRYLKKVWAPLHREPIDKITRKMVKDRRDELVDAHGAVTGNQALAALSTFFSWAIDREHRQTEGNPTRDIKALRKNKRTRVLSEAELVEIWQACGDDDYGRIVKLLMLTGQRRTEIGELEWTEISMERRQISLPAARSKNKQPHIIPLSEPALKLLQGLPSDVRFVFGGYRPFKAWHGRKAWLDKRAPLEPWTIHDIRRSVVTCIAELGYAQPHVIEAIVNHISGHKAGVAGTYNKATYLPEKRKALEDWGRYLTGLVGAPSSAKNSNPANAEQIDRQPADGTR